MLSTRVYCSCSRPIKAISGRGCSTSSFSVCHSAASYSFFPPTSSISLIPCLLPCSFILSSECMSFPHFPALSLPFICLSGLVFSLFPLSCSPLISASLNMSLIFILSVVPHIPLVMCSPSTAPHFHSLPLSLVISCSIPRPPSASHHLSSTCLPWSFFPSCCTGQPFVLTS